MKARQTKPAPPLADHVDMVRRYEDALLERVYWQLRRQNLRDYSDDETRWKAERLKAVAAERRARKAALKAQLVPC